MQLELPAELEGYLDAAVARGEFESREALVTDAVRRHRDRAEKLEWLRAEIQKGIDSIKRGDGITINGEEELRAYFDEIRQEALEVVDNAMLTDNWRDDHFKFLGNEVRKSVGAMVCDEPINNEDEHRGWWEESRREFRSARDTSSSSLQT